MRREKQQSKKNGRKRTFQKKEDTSHLDLIRELKELDRLPAIYFILSRKKCETMAKSLAKEFDFPTLEEKQKILQVFNEKITDETRNMKTSILLKNVLRRGIGIHHAGLLPTLKEIVEELFGLGIIKVLFTTETFAVGINMPAKSVCFHSLEKYDGISHRYFNTKEYFQLAGRAGRRGIDTIGYSIAQVNEYSNLDKIREITYKDIEPITSQFKLTTNTILNIINSHTDAEIEIVLKSSFDYFQKRKRTTKQVRIKSVYNNKVQKLLKMNFIKEIEFNDEYQVEGKNRTYELTEKGLFARFIYGNEIVITELFHSHLYEDLTDIEILIIIGALDYEPRRLDKFENRDFNKIANTLISKIKQNENIMRYMKKEKVSEFYTNIRNLYAIISRWYTGCEFDELLQYTNILEGDIIRLFRRIIDILRQIKNATPNYEVKDRIGESIKTIDRDLIRFDFIPDDEDDEENNKVEDITKNN